MVKIIIAGKKNNHISLSELNVKEKTESASAFSFKNEFPEDLEQETIISTHFPQYEFVSVFLV